MSRSSLDCLVLVSRHSIHRDVRVSSLKSLGYITRRIYLDYSLSIYWKLTQSPIRPCCVYLHSTICISTLEIIGDIIAIGILDNASHTVQVQLGIVSVLLVRSSLDRKTMKCCSRLKIESICMHVKCKTTFSTWQSCIHLICVQQLVSNYWAINLMYVRQQMLTCSPTCVRSYMVK